MTQRDIDPRLLARGAGIETPPLEPGEPYWRVVRARWYDEQEADRLGPDHHIMADALVEGVRIPRTHMTVMWPTGEADIVVEAKQGEPYGANFPMSPSRNEFSIRVADPDYASETLRGIGMGADTPRGFNPGIHTSTGVVFQLARQDQESPPADPPSGSRDEIRGLIDDAMNKLRIARELL